MAIQEQHRMTERCCIPMTRKLLAAFMAVVLGVSLCPMPSYADEYEGGSVDSGTATLDQGTLGYSQADAPAPVPTGEDGLSSGSSSADAAAEEADQLEGEGALDASVLQIGVSDGALYELEIANATGYPIDSIQVKASASQEWHDLTFDFDASWADGETANVAFPDLRSTVDPALMESVGNDSLYDLKLFAGEDSYEMHAIGFADIQEASLLWDDLNGLYYFDLTRADGEVVSTLEAEIAYVQSQNDDQAEPDEEAQPDDPEGDGASPEDEGAVPDEGESDDQPVVEEEDEADSEEDDEEDAVEDDDEIVMSVQEAEELTGVESSKAGVEYEEGEVLVFLEDGTQVSDISQVLKKSPVTDTDKVKEDNLFSGSIEGDDIVSTAGMNPAVVVDVDSDVTVPQAIAMLSSKPNVAEVTPNYIFEVHGEEDEAPSGSGVDPSNHKYDSEVDMMNASAESSVRAIQAWSHCRSEHDVAVAVIDTGCNIAHEDLASNVIATYNSVDGSSNVTDKHGHGTHVSGIACAAAGNGIGVAGSSYNADLVAVKASYTGPSGTDGDFKTSTLLGAISWIIANKDSFSSPIRVINLSLGSVGSASTLMGNSLCRAIDAANEAGILVVASAGNSGGGISVPNTCYPADYDACLSVINLSAPFYTARYQNSNYNAPGVTASTVNATKDISAPGNLIMSTSAEGSYKSMTGTSMAAPVVSGIAALCFAADPSLSPADVTSILESTATDLGSEGWDSETGYGRVDADAALHSILGDPSDGEVGGEAPDSNDGIGSDLTPVDVPEAVEGLEWTGEDQQGVIVDSEIFDIEGDVASKPGKHVATVTLKEGYSWSDGTTDARQVEWMIEPLGTVMKPAVETEFSYDGTQKQVLIAGEHYFVSETEDADWDSRASHAEDGIESASGDYVCYAILEPGYAWDDDSSDPMKIEWSISSGTLKSSNVTLSATSFTYTGSAIKPTVKVVVGGKTLVQGTDYTVTYSNNVDAGTASVKVVGTGNYSGTVTKNYTIVALHSLSDATCTLGYTTAMKTGSALKPAVTVMYDGEKLVSGTDYTVTYKNNVNAGLASVVITGKGAYSGSVTKTFRIFNKFTGWYEYSGKWYYGVNGALASGWRQISGAYYYFNTTSKAMATGLIQVSGKYYYCDSSGARQSGWVQTGGYWYYFGGTSSSACIGWKSVGGTWYYFNAKGRMLTGLLLIDGKYYYCDSSGAMQTGWVKTGGYWYYFGGSGGEACIGWKSIGGSWYYFKSNGRMVTGTQIIDGVKYYFDSSGAMQ